MNKPARPPLPWEETAAIGALALLAVQATREVVLTCLGRTGHDSTPVGTPIHLLLYAGVAVGLFRRSRTSWWLGLLVIGGNAVAHLAETWSPIMESFRYATEAEYQMMALQPCYDGLGLVWEIARNVLLLAVPTLLFLGELRKELRRIYSET